MWQVAPTAIGAAEPPGYPATPYPPAAYGPEPYVAYAQETTMIGSPDVPGNASPGDTYAVTATVVVFVSIVCILGCIFFIMLVLQNCSTDNETTSEPADSNVRHDYAKGIVVPRETSRVVSTVVSTTRVSTAQTTTTQEPTTTEEPITTAHESTTARETSRVVSTVASTTRETTAQTTTTQEPTTTEEPITTAHESTTAAEVTTTEETTDDTSTTTEETTDYSWASPSPEVAAAQVLRVSLALPTSPLTTRSTTTT
ncbi:hypothetical protein MTO96_017543 [Rhipicephalus appendiculatus]